MSAFLIADVAVSDMQAYIDSGYIETVPTIAARFGGVYRARGGDFEVLEGDWRPVRLVIIEFPDMDRLRQFYECEEYSPFREIRVALTDSKIVALDGLAEPITL